MTKHQEQDYVPFGLWVYIMSDCVLFACLFAAYAVLHLDTGVGHAARDIFDRSFVLGETLILLTSSFTCGLAVLAAVRKQVAGVWSALSATLALGATFLFMELHEFSGLIATGDSWHASAFLSSYFSLVGLHGLHIFAGLLWMCVLMSYIALRGLTDKMAKRVFYFSLFWHFLDIVWIFIFSFVYLFGSLSL
jgi:cytochrome o ubiquinol oxidase subunit 3